MRPIHRHTSPIVDVVNNPSGDFEIDPCEFEVHSSVIIRNIPSSFVLQSAEEYDQGNALAWGGALVFLSLAFESILPVFLAGCYLSFKTFVLQPYIKQQSAVAVLKIGLRDDAFVLNALCQTVGNTRGDVVVLIDRPSKELWSLITSSEVLKRCLMNHACSRVVIVPALWQMDCLAAVAKFGAEVWSVYCDDVSSDDSLAPRSGSPSPSPCPSDSSSIASDFSVSDDLSPSFRGVVEASK